ncbi:hypothetical protein KS4_26240 [Poriferisphaera corsica]|uniref:DUF5009 domain-containing protein n=1 Tax=Poriferisphaera corsica TaxID=2528020 RepID=A0A517YWG2_9BACT|nr:DUF5009 domain-containing protein [Poriferisphaera corsica]QDU34554.1 hypothetical protein KS4_26240 [Poriferisphaera corsica]
MTSTTHTASIPSLNQTASSPRIISIDILRGFIMLTMLFVNDVAETPKLWWWSKHFYPYNESGMTYVDVVFPAFLFIVGLSVPFALSKQLQTKPLHKVLLHVLTRSASLLLLGFFTVNGPDFEKMGWHNAVWHILVYSSCIALFLQFPKPNPEQRSNRKIVLLKYTSITIKALATIGLFIAWYYFQDKNGNPMQRHWWGILGLIGWTYLCTSLIYIVFRKNIFALAIVMAILIAMYLGHQPIQPATWQLPANNAFNSIPHHNFIFKLKYIPMSTTILTAISLAGALLGSTIKNGSPNTNGSLTNTNAAKLKFALLFAAALALAGYCMQYPHGILKNSSSPAWALYSAAITAALWAIFFLLFDMLNFRKIGSALAYAGQNALLAYLIAPLFLFSQIFINTYTCINPKLTLEQQFWITPLAFTYDKINMFGHTITFLQPFTGIAKSILLAILILVFTAFLARKKIFLKL